jgi:hypothetical protein
MYQGSPTAPGGVSALRLPATVVRFTWRQLRYDPQTVADRIQAILGRGSSGPSLKV